MSGAFLTGPQGILYQDNVVGAGATPVSGDLVTASYVGTFTDGGQKFDASKRFGPFAVGTGEVISGWDLTILGAEAMPPMRVGGMRTVMLPPALAYGTRGAGCRPNGTCVIPPESGLTFVIGLLNVAPARR